MVRSAGVVLFGLCAALAPSGTIDAQEPVTPAVIGAVVPDLSFVDIRSQRRHLSDFGPRAAIVLFFVTVDCPMVGREFPALSRLADRFAADDVQFAAVNVSRSDSIRAMGTQALVFDQRYPFVRDEDGRVAKALGVDRTTTAVVLDAERRLRYRGRVDDQVRFANVKAAAARADLALAIEAVLAGESPEVAETPALGCKITFGSGAIPSTELTYHRDIEPLIQKHCQECHREGGAAPFDLLSYDDVADQAEMIAEVVGRQRMPPWHASDAFGTFRNRRALDAADRERLLDWVRSGAPRGDAAVAPPPRTFPDGPWRIGEPDLIIKSVAPIRLPADGIVPYSYIILPYAFREDAWVEAVEILPENKRVLHHANLAWFDPTKGFSQDGFITGFVPGGDAMVLDPGTAMRIPAGSRLGIQAHYVTTGKPESDRIRVGLRFPRQAATRRAEVIVVTNTRFVIPAGASAHPVVGRRRVHGESTLIGLFAHMHLRGRDMTFIAHRPDAPADTLLMVPNYDFDWQSSYRAPEGAVRFPAGTQLEVIAHFDNSAFNPFNPDPTVDVRFGEQTFEEMMYGFAFVTRDDETLALEIDPRNGHVVSDRGGER